MYTVCDYCNWFFQCQKDVQEITFKRYLLEKLTLCEIFNFFSINASKKSSQFELSKTIDIFPQHS